MGFYVGLSTNGTLIDEPMADRIAADGFDYVGISLDGIRETHDRSAAWTAPSRSRWRRAPAARARREGRPALHHDAG
jgi:molybdenum cofactor biosynthesis enzyme MoaA